ELVRLAEAERRCRPVGAATARLRIAAVCFLREAPAGSAHRTELLCVRKHGTGSWMQVGGKLDPGESARDAALREVEEELGAVLEDTDLEVLGDFEAVAANEPGTVVRSSVFVTRAPLPAPLRVRAALADQRGIPVAGGARPGGAGGWAPRRVQHIRPARRRRGAGSAPGPSGPSRRG